MEGGGFRVQGSGFRVQGSGWLFAGRGIPNVTLGQDAWVLLGPVDPSFRALSGRLKFTVRRHKFNAD